MRYATVYITDNEYSHFIELAKNLSYIRKIETDHEVKGCVFEHIKAGLEEVHLFQKNKLNTISAKDFLNEI